MLRPPSPRLALLVFVSLCVVVVGGLVGSQPGAPLAVDRGGHERSAQGQASGKKKDAFHPVTLTDKNKPHAKVLTHPNELALVAAHSKVFDVRTLKSKVVKLERPENEAPGLVDPDAMSGEDPDAGRETDSDQDAGSAVDPDAQPDPDQQMPQTVDPDSQRGSGSQAAPAPAPSASFDGLDFTNWGAGHPPDPNGDVGPSYYIQAINSSVGIYNKSNGNRVAAFTFNAFMSQGSFGNLCDTNNFGDPVVLYDTYEDRWFVTDFAFKLDASGNVNPQTVFQCFAVSKTGDPVNGGWNFYSILDPGGLADYPKFGVWPDGIYMSANMFGYSSSSSYAGFHVWALNKQQMYAGAPSVQVVDFAGDTSDFTLIPANSRLQTGTPPAGTSEYFVSTWNYLNALSIYKFHADWDMVSASTFSGPFTQGAPSCWPNSPVANASTTANAADVLPIRAMAQAQYANLGGTESVWVDHTVNRGVIPLASCGNTAANNATVRWYQANVTGGTVAANVVQGASYDPEAANTFFRYMPSLAVDRAGDMAVGYSKSNSTTNPQIKYAGRLAGDPVNTLGQGEQTLIDGTGSQSGNCGTTCVRWGDYTGMALDPNGCAFWMTNEYFATTGLNSLTRIGSFSYPSCTPVGNGTLSGAVTDGVNPVAGAAVALGSRSTTTDGSGHYAFTVPAGTYPSASAGKPGFDPASASSLIVPNGGTLTQNFALTASAQSGCFTDNTQSTFQRGVPSNCNLVVNPGTVVLANPDSTDARNSTVSPSGFAFTNTSWAGQTFTPTVTGQLKRVDVELFCLCTVTSPTVSLSIRATTGGTPVPTGGDLATATLPGFNDGGTGGLKTFTFASPTTLTAGTRYAFVFRLNSAPAGGNTVAFTCSCVTTGFANSNPYAGGQLVTSSTSGASWAADTTAGGRDLNFTTYINPGFAASGTFVSSLKDANPAAGNTPNWTTLTYGATTPAGTDVKVQIAGSNSANGPFSYVGPDGTAATTFTSGASLSQFNGFRYLKYKAILSTTNGAVTPTLSSVQICFTDVGGVASTALDVAPASGAFAGTTTVSATLTSGATPVAGKLVSFSLNGSGVGSATTDVNGVATLNNASLSGINAGSYPTGVSASFAGDGAFATSSGTDVLTVNRADQTVIVTSHAPASAIFASSFTVAATAPGGVVTFSSSGACSNVGATFTMTSGTGSCSVKYDQAGNANYNAASQIVETTSAAESDQTISVTTHAPASATVGISFTVAATAPGGLVTFSSSGACSNVGATFTMTSGTGSCSVKYDQAGNTNYNAAPEVTETVTAGKSDQTITVTTHAPSSAAFNSSFSIAATAPGGTVTFSSSGACSNVGATFTMTSGIGSCSVKYDQAGNTNYNAAPEVTETTDADKADQTINVTTHAPASATFGSGFTVAATAPGGLVTFSSSGGCSNTVGTFTMTSGTTSCLVKYDQAGNANYNAAPEVTETTSAGKASTSTSLSSSANPSVFGQPVSFTATVSSGAGTPTGTVQFKIDGVNFGAAVALDATGHAVSGSTNTLAVGGRAITAVYSGATNFATSTGTLSQSVAKANVTVSVTSNHNPVTKGTSITFTVTVAPASPSTRTPGGKVKLFRNGTQIGSKKSLSGGKVSWTITWTAGTGTFNMTAKYLGNTNFNAKTSPAYSQVVTP